MEIFLESENMLYRTEETLNTSDHKCQKKQLIKNYSLISLFLGNSLSERFKIEKLQR